MLSKYLSVLSAFPNPIFKNLKFLDNDQRKSVKEKVIDLAKMTGSHVIVNYESCPVQKRMKKSALDELIGETEDDIEELKRHNGKAYTLKLRQEIK